MFTFRVTTDDRVIHHQGTSRSEAVEVALSLQSEYGVGSVECRDVDACGHYGHSRWQWSKEFDEFLAWNDEILALQDALTTRTVLDEFPGLTCATATTPTHCCACDSAAGPSVQHDHPDMSGCEVCDHHSHHLAGIICAGHVGGDGILRAASSSS